ncbi:hypothetical protein EG68_08725, partial [Paragonimus skrjabini miyazakii]
YITPQLQVSQLFAPPPPALLLSAPSLPAPPPPALLLSAPSLPAPPPPALLLSAPSLPAPPLPAPSTPKALPPAESSLYPIRCSLSINAGCCTDKISKYAFVLEKKQCQMFVYSGCGGNGNRFDTLQECMDFCKRKS